MKPALVLVDLQRDYLAAPGLEPIAENLIQSSARLVETFREREWPVLHVLTTIEREEESLPHWRLAKRPMCVVGTAGHAPPASVAPAKGEVTLHKQGFNAFRGDQLESALRRAGCDTVMLAGVHLHTCIRMAAMECLERGYDVVIAEDATGTNDPIHAAATRRWLDQRCVRFETTARISSGLSEAPAKTLTHVSPRNTGERFEARIMGKTEVEAAVGRARDSSFTWQRVPLATRLRLLEVLAGKLETSTDSFAKAMAVQIGKPLTQGREETRRAAANVRDVALRAARQSLEKVEAPGRVRYRPHGVVAIIPAWNNPVAIPLGKIAPALAYGNTVVWKPAPAATRIATEISGLLHDSGFPAEAIQCVTGDHTTAQLLAASEFVDAVTFTGSVASGYALQEICARRMRPLQAELGGNNAAIVWEDADVIQAATEIARGAFGFAGQRCTANRRVIVAAQIYETFLAELQRAAERMVWDDPMRVETEIGPVISAAKRQEVEGLIARAQNIGGRTIPIQAAGRGAELAQSGHYAQPAIICCDEPSHSLVQAETMGPLLIVQRVESFEEALDLCNGVQHGLLAALFTTVPALQQKFLEEARAGMLKLNSSTAGVDVRLPFGGWKASGLGPPEHGESDALFYLRPQALYGEFPP